MNTARKPLIVALPLDHDTDDVLAASLELGQRLKCPIIVVHALGERRMENERILSLRIERTRQTLEPRLARLRGAGLEVTEELAVRPPADLVIETAQRVGAELIVTGGGRPATVRRWLVGSVAEAIVRRASVPVWVARGVPPLSRPVLCPVDSSPQSELGLAAAIRMAQLFEVPLRAMTVLSERSAAGAQAVQEARRGIEERISRYGATGLPVDVVVDKGAPADRIAEAADDAGLLVVGSRGFDPLVPEWLGPVTTRSLRASQCSLLAIREVDVDLDLREQALATLAEAYQAARELAADDRADEALPLIASAAERAPFNATIQETYAIVLERLGRDVEARGRHEIAKLIRSRIGPA